MPPSFDSEFKLIKCHELSETKPNNRPIAGNLWQVNGGGKQDIIESYELKLNNEKSLHLWNYTVNIDHCDSF